MGKLWADIENMSMLCEIFILLCVAYGKMALKDYEIMSKLLKLCKYWERKI